MDSDSWFGGISHDWSFWWFPSGPSEKLWFNTLKQATTSYLLIFANVVYPHTQRCIGLICVTGKASLNKIGNKHQLKIDWWILTTFLSAHCHCCCYMTLKSDVFGFLKRALGANNRGTLQNTLCISLHCRPKTFVWKHFWVVNDKYRERFVPSEWIMSTVDCICKKKIYISNKLMSKLAVPVICHHTVLNL
jgi:hypothetical protein